MRISGGRQQVRIGISRRRFNTILTDIIRAPLEKPLEFTPTPSLDAPVLRTILSLVNACFIIGQETSSDEEKARALLDTLELTLLNFWPNNFANDFTSAGGAVMPHHVRLAMELIQGDPFAKLDVHSLAKSTGVSVRTLQHNFRKFRSCSITEYILECRMRRLHDNRNSPGFINDVAESVGPNAMSRMRQIFRARFGRDLLQS